MGGGTHPFIKYQEYFSSIVFSVPQKQNIEETGGITYSEHIFPSGFETLVHFCVEMIEKIKLELSIGKPE